MRKFDVFFLLAFLAQWWSFSVTFGITWNVFWMYFNALGNNTNVEMHFSFVYIHCLLEFTFKTRHSAKVIDCAWTNSQAAEYNAARSNRAIIGLILWIHHLCTQCIFITLNSNIIICSGAPRGGVSQGNCPGARALLGARDYNPKWKLPITCV